MKNIHLIPTDNSSRLYYNKNKSKVILNNTIAIDWYISEGYKAHNIYITSSEEVNKTDYVIVSCSEAEIEAVNLVTGYYNEQFLFDDRTQIHMDYCRKIILTTDPELIADGIQRIDDEFLEWYVKNPNCEEVKTEITDISCLIPNFGDVDKYKIIIPKDFTIKSRVSTVEYSEHTKKVVEEHNLMYDKVIEFINNNIEEFDKALELHRRKKHIINMMKSDEELGLYEQPKNSGKTLADMKCSCMKYAAGSFSANCRNCGLPPKTENNSMNRVGTFCDKCRQVMCQCKSTQHTPKEEMLVEIKTKLYSKEDMEQAFIEGHNVCRYFTDNMDEAKECFNEWFNKFKK